MAVEVFRSDSKTCTAYGLALQAAGIFHSIEYRDRDYAIVVADADADRARAEIAAYAEESQEQAETIPSSRAPSARGWIGALGYALTLATLTALQQNQVFATDWLSAGRNRSELLRDGEWWRPVTALTLHADFAHLVSNLGFGCLIGFFVGQVMGSGLGWLCILLCGAGGNVLSALIRPPGYSSIGASTAVFAALGILAGHTWTSRRRLRASTLAKLAPIVGGVILLSHLGTGGERTDVLSHMTGFACGVTCGGLYGKMDRRVGRGGQVVPSVAAIAVLAIAWAFALR